MAQNVSYEVAQTTSHSINDLEEFKATITSYAVTEGKVNASQNLPVTLDECRACIINYLESSGQELINKNHADLAPISGVVIATSIRTKANEDITNLSAGLQDIEHRVAVYTNEKKRLAPPYTSTWKRILPKFAIILISLSEFYFILEALRIGGLSFIPAVLLGAGLACGLGYLMHIAAGWIKYSQSKGQLYRRILITTIPVAILFYFLGVFRSRAYQADAELTAKVTHTAPVHTASGTGIALISFILFSIGLVIAIRYAKTKREREQEEQYLQACKALKNEEAEKEAVIREIATIRKDSEEKIAISLSNYERALTKEKQIKLICKKALEAYAASNRRNRTDGICPSFFATLPELSFTSLFPHSNQTAQ